MAGPQAGLRLMARSGLRKDATYVGQIMAPWQRKLTTPPSATSKDSFRLEETPWRIRRAWCPGSSGTSTVAWLSMVPTVLPSTVMSKTPRRSSKAKGVSRVNLSIAGTGDLLVCELFSCAQDVLAASGVRVSRPSARDEPLAVEHRRHDPPS